MAFAVVSSLNLNEPSHFRDGFVFWTRFAFNASLSAINIAKELSMKSGLDLSVEDVKLLIHNTVMVQRVLSTFGKTPNFNLNQKNIKELLFYGVKTAA